MEPRSLDEKLNAIEARLARIEHHLYLSPIASTTQTKPLDNNQDNNQTVTNTSPETKQNVGISGNWLGIISIICFVLAAGFIIKLSIESGWLTPARQIGIAALLGFSVIGAGLKFINLDREYISLLPAAGIIILYLSTFAAYRFYGLIPFESAIICTGIISLLCIFIYLKIQHNVYPITAAVGNYLAPALLGLNIDSTFTLYYFVICSLTFAVISIGVKSRLLTIVAAYLAILMTAAVGLDLNQNALIVTCIALQFFIFSIGTFLYTFYAKQPLTQNESWCFFPVLLLFYSTEYFYIYLIQPDLAPWISLAFAAFLICLYLLAQRIANNPKASQTMILTFVAIVLFHSGYLELLPLQAKPWLFVGIILGLACMPTRYASKDKNILFYFPILLLMLSIVGIEYARMAINLFFLEPISWPVVAITMLSIWILYIFQNDTIRHDDSYGYALLGSVHLMVILAFIVLQILMARWQYLYPG